MLWASDAQRDMVGDDAARIVQEYGALHAMGLWPDKHVMRARLVGGEAAWLRVTKEGMLQCVALAPWDDVWTVDCVAEAAFFGRGTWPPTWKRKLEVLGPAPVRNGYDCGWAVGLLPDKVQCVLCKPEQWTAHALHSVQVEIDGPVLSVAEHSALRWWPYANFTAGVEALWAARRTQFPNYRFLAISASNEMRKLGLLPKVTRKRGQSSKP